MKEIKVLYEDYKNKYSSFTAIKGSFNVDDKTIILNLDNVELTAYEIMTKHNFAIYAGKQIIACVKYWIGKDIEDLKKRIESNTDAIVDYWDNEVNAETQQIKENIIMVTYILEKKLSEKKKEAKLIHTGVTRVEVLQEAFPDMNLRLVQNGECGHIMLASTYKNQELALCRNDERLYLDCILNYRKAVDFMEENANEYVNIELFGESYEEHSVKDFMQSLKINASLNEVAKLD